MIKNGCDTISETTVFEVDSVTGNITSGIPGTNSVTVINGSLTLTGSCGSSTGAYPSPNPATDSHLTLKNPYGTSFDVNVCNGDVTIGTTVGSVFAIGGYWSGTPVAHNTTTSVVQSYRFDKFTLNAGGPVTTVSAGFTVDDFDIPVASITPFAKGDLLLIYNGSTQAEIVIVTAVPFTTNNQGYLPTIYNAEYPAGTYPNGGRGAEGTTKKNWSAGATVVKLRKYNNTTTLVEAIPATGRVAAVAPTGSGLINSNPNRIVVKLADSRIISNKLDTAHFFKITTGSSVEFFYADSIDGNNSSYGVRLAKSTQAISQAPTGTFTAYFGGGTTTINDAVEIYSGELRMYGSDGETLIFNVANDDDHVADGAILDPKTNKGGMYLKGHIFADGDLVLRSDYCESWGACNTTVNFKAFGDTGNLEMGQKLYVKGKIVQTSTGDASTPVLHIDNLGGAGTNGTVGPRDFIIYQDGSIDSFGIKRYFTRNGGRRYTYVEQSLTGIGQTVANPLQPNNNYILNNPSGTNMVLYLPDYAETGDVIRFIECSGNLTYDTSLVLRAIKINNQATAIQGDTSGSKIQAGTGQLTTAWDSGELIVQTRNASFGLVFVGPTDAAGDPNAQSIPSNLRGWWLMEL